MRNILAVLATPLALAACVSQSAEPRIREALLSYGVEARQAGCMADDLSKRLSLGQLRTLSRLASEAKHDRYKQRPVGELVRLAERAADPDMVVKVTRATLGCVLLG